MVHFTASFRNLKLQKREKLFFPTFQDKKTVGGHRSTEKWVECIPKLTQEILIKTPKGTFSLLSRWNYKKYN